jgi:hypothetical protein
MTAFSVYVLNHGNVLNELDDNVDVEITLENAIVYSATFFTIENIRTLLMRYRQSGECAGGVYMWATDMIIVESLTLENIQAAVQDLIETGGIDHACRRIN